MKITGTDSSIVLVGSKSEILKTLQVISMKYETVQEWIEKNDGRILYVVK